MKNMRVSIQVYHLCHAYHYGKRTLQRRNQRIRFTILPQDIVFRFEESELATKHCRYVVPTERKLHPRLDNEMMTAFGNGKTATTTANSWRTVQRNKQSSREMISRQTTEDNQGDGNQRDSLCLQKGYLDVRFMFATKSPAASATFNLARSMKEFIIADRQLDKNFCILPLYGNGNPIR
jgi:hypothetical protein